MGIQIIKTGKRYIGTPYRFGAKPFQTKEFDCSSFVQYVYASYGIILPRTSRQQIEMGQPVSIDELQPGDLLFFTTKKRKGLKGIDRVGHVGMYMGNKKMLHTFKEGNEVKVSKLSRSWMKKFLGARRVL
ncbi:C40 family peptidase [Pseudalkalibacillus caeni]|uniref:C40 family peptidase n=1 Tax=Exobacillus caeni TaxID=2574798 RepID=UPI0014854847|nr:C40 family peptidase [Pseudalkalibacillus caeni]